MEQRASDELAALAAREGFHLTPIFDPRLFCAHDSRVRDAKVFLDGKEIDRVNRAYVGENGWVDAYPQDADGNLLVKDDAFVIDRHHGAVRIVRPDGHVFE